MLEIPALLERVESLLTDETADETLLGEVNFYRGFMLTVFQGDAEGALIRLEAARKQLPKSQTLAIRSDLETLAALASQMVGEGALAIRSLDQKIHAIGSGKGLFLSRLVFGQVWVHLLSADLLEAIRAARRFTTACKRTGGIDNSAAGSRYLRANADFQSYHLDEALQGFQYAARKRDIIHRKLAIDTQVGLVLTYQAMQRSEDAVNVMKQLMEFVMNTGDPDHLATAQSSPCHGPILPGPALAVTG
jgi:tetratricopeptide (TPR) repeat protein